MFHVTTAAAAGCDDTYDDVIQVWTMIIIYLAVACVAVIIVVVFVDNLPSDLVERQTNVHGQV